MKAEMARRTIPKVVSLKDSSDISSSNYTAVATPMPLNSTTRARIIGHENTFLMRNLLSRAVIGRTRARLIETRLGKIYVTPKMRHMFSVKSHNAGKASVKKLIISLDFVYSGSYRL